MPKRNPAAQFLLDVCSGVRWKKAHCTITQELANHIDDQTSAYRAEGMPPEEVEQEAVRQMGDPVALGKQFDAVYRPQTAWGLIVCIALMLLGSVFLQVCLLPGGLRISQAAVMICGLAVAAAAYFIDFRQLFARWALPAYLLCLLLAGWFSPEINGASIPLSYLLLLSPLPLCGCVNRCRNLKWRGLFLSVAAALLPLGIALFLHASPAALAIAGISCFLLLALAAGNGWFALPRWQALTAVLLPVLLMGVCCVISFSHRLLPVLFPAQDPHGAGFFPLTIRSMLSDAVLIGPGAAFADIPNKIPVFHDSFMLTWLIARYGWIVMVPVCALFLWLIGCGAVFARRQNSFFGKLLCTAAISVFSLQALAYLCANCGLLISTYFPLPLLYGGNYSTLVNLLLMGILLSAVRHGSLYTDASAPQPLFDYADGTLHVHLK